MEVIQAAKELGKAIQADRRYKDYVSAKEANDKDEGLQQLIGEFNLKRENVQYEANKPDESRNDEKIQKMNKELQECYEKVMGNPNMANFVIVKNAMDKLLQEVQNIIGLSCEGEDPETCHYQASSCTSDCSTCGGCH